jgi:hypothetical protein
LCPNFGAEDFYAQVQHKLIVKELLADPRKLAGLTGEKWANAARDDDDILGGVSIMDISDEAPLLLDSGVMVPTNADNTGGVPINKQDFPSLQDSVTDTKGKAKSKDHNSTGPLVQPNDEVTVIKDKVNTPALEDKSDYETLFYSTPTEMTGASRKSGPPTRPPNPWKAGGPSSKTMFPTAKATLADHAWIAKVKEAESNSNNMLYRQFWNPDSKDYNADRF